MRTRNKKGLVEDAVQQKWGKRTNGTRCSTVCKTIDIDSWPWMKTRRNCAFLSKLQGNCRRIKPPPTATVFWDETCSATTIHRASWLNSCQGDLHIRDATVPQKTGHVYKPSTHMWTCMFETGRDLRSISSYSAQSSPGTDCQNCCSSALGLCYVPWSLCAPGGMAPNPVNERLQWVLKQTILWLKFSRTIPRPSRADRWQHVFHGNLKVKFVLSEEWSIITDIVGFI